MRGVFWLSTAMLCYTYAGYPLLVMALARIRRRPVRTAPYEPAVSIIIAARNEAKSIRATLENKLQLHYPAGRVQIIVVSDASTDGTDAIVREYEPAGVLLLRQEPRRGKTAALNLAAAHATGRIFVFADANSMYAADALRMLTRNFADPSVGYVTGRLVYGAAAGSSAGIGCRAYMRYEDLLRRSETSLGSIVGVNGGIDAVRRELLVRMHDDQLPDFVLPLQVVKQGYRVVYEPEALLYEDTLTTSSAEYRMRVRVALRAWWALSDMRALLNVRRHGLFAMQLFSHKVLRYAACAAVPVVYAAALGASGAGLIYDVAVALGSAFLLCAAAGFAADRAGVAAPVVSLPYYFMVINAASADALLKFLRGRKQAVWTPRLG
ncbi:MAG: glycosyltransferase family 2 protein [Gammaproteobacteria bacterium]|nr:MAG: glycosyltransferase family 2 protein [Gammaproteobacteria bacterium]